MTKLPDGQLVRFHAYLEPDRQWVIGHANESHNGYGPAVLRPLAGYNDRTTAWQVDYRNDDQFRLRWAESPNLYLGIGSRNDAMRLTAEPTFIEGPMCLFTIDDLNPSPWFALNNWDHSRVADIRRSDMHDGNDVIGFPWNGGDNQKWRYEVVN